MAHLIKTAFITGGAQGLGKAFTQSLLKKGIKVCFVDIQDSVGKQTESELKQVYGEDKVQFYQCDVTSSARLSECFNAAVKKFGNLDLMVNNAGIGDESKLAKMININLTAAIEGSQLAIEHMRKDKGGRGGRIVNVASTAGLTPVYFNPVYCASKFGLVGYHYSLAVNPHNKEMGVQFGCLCPAFTETAIIKFDDRKVQYLEEGLKLMKKIGINKVSDVVEGFHHFVDQEEFNGDCVTVVAGYGINVENKVKKALARL